MWLNTVKIHRRCFYSVVVASFSDLGVLVCPHLARIGRARCTQCCASFPSHPALSVVPLDSGTRGQGNNIVPCITQMTLFHALW